MGIKMSALRERTELNQYHTFQITRCTVYISLRMVDKVFIQREGGV